VRYLVCIILLGVSTAVSALAQDLPSNDRGVRFHGLGPRLGVSIDPGQFIFGAQADFGDPFPHGTWLFPVIEVAMGEDRTLTYIGTDLLLKMARKSEAWNPYLGGELAFIIDHRNLVAGDGTTDTSFGFLGLIGIEKVFGAENRFSVEVKADLSNNIVDTPDFKLITSWTFGH
jgi:hypothetical protein